MNKTQKIGSIYDPKQSHRNEKSYGNFLPLNAARVLQKTPRVSSKAFISNSMKYSFGTPPWYKSAIKFLDKYVFLVNLLQDQKFMLKFTP